MTVYYLKSFQDKLNYNYYVKLTFFDKTRIVIPCLSDAEAELLNGLAVKKHPGIGALRTKEGVEYPTCQIRNSLKFSSKKDFEAWRNSGKLNHVTYV